MTRDIDKELQVSAVEDRPLRRCINGHEFYCAKWGCPCPACGKPLDQIQMWVTEEGQ